MYYSSMTLLKDVAPKTAEMFENMGGKKGASVGDFKDTMNKIMLGNMRAFDVLLRSISAEAPHINMNEGY
jgi:hypothetical protein